MPNGLNLMVQSVFLTRWIDYLSLFELLQCKMRFCIGLCPRSASSTSVSGSEKVSFSSLLGFQFIEGRERRIDQLYC